MITRYFIENIHNHQWYTGLEWTTDPHIAKGFDSEHDASIYINSKLFYMAIDLYITEHEVSSPIPTPHTQN